MSAHSGVVANVVRVTTTGGAVDVVAEPGLLEVLADGATVEQEGVVSTLRGDRGPVRARVPEGTDVIIGSWSGRVRISGRVGAAAVLTSSGSVSIEEAASVDVRSTSGRIRIRDVENECRVVSVSSRLGVVRCGSADVTTTSGRVVLRSIHGPARVHCVSGRIDLSMAGAFDVDAEAVSGRISVSLPKGVRPNVVSLPPVDRAEADFDCVVLARSVSGRVDVKHR